MELEESIRIIQTGMAWANWTSNQKQAMLIALESIKKQIPQKTKHNQFCPICCNTVAKLYGMPGYKCTYCPNCGQKLSYIE